jgi:hypothetical protein
MDTADEVIALLLDDADGSWPPAEPIDLASTTCLVRGADGHVRLEKPDSQEELDRTAETTGVFKRGKPILDPGSGDVIGYEMEEIRSVSIAAR